MGGGSPAYEAPLLVDGELVGGEGGWAPTLNPATEEPIGRYAVAGRADVDRAVAAAAAAQPGWDALGVQGRGDLLLELGARLLARADELLALEVSDSGNTVTRMRRDVAMGVDALRYFAGIGPELKGETIPATPGNLHLTVREPYGVVGRIVPFNHPFYFSLSRIAAPLVAGNAVVLKPPEQSPLSSAVLAEECRRVLPSGVVNVVNGAGAVVGDAIVRHPAVKRIGFTGSVPTGLAIQRAAAETGVKAVSLELGGKNPMIVFPDVDPVVAADAALAGMNFAWQGQSCGSTSRLLLHESMYDDVLALLAAKAAALRLGDPGDPATEMGPLNSAAHYEQVLAHVDNARADGATLVTGGRRPAGFDRGYWLEPTVFAVSPRMRLARQEVFGPVLSVLRWRTFEEAIELMNGTEYGLTASIWTSDLDTALAAARGVRAGYVWVNGYSTHYRGVPFGGVKASGVGSDEDLEELRSFTEVKAINVMIREPRRTAG